MLFEVAAGTAAVLALLGTWQRHIERRQRARVVSEIQEAKDRGTDRPVGQYPHIDRYACIGCGSCVRACPENGVLDLVDGIAHVVQASKCIGHALCAQVCPVDALTVGLGDTSRRPDIPSLTEELESTVPGIFIAGELGGLALIRHAVDQGVRAVEAIARRRPDESPPPGVADVLIVGAGPCGIAASLKAVECGLDYLTIDQDDTGGTIRKYPRRKLVMTQPVTLPLGEMLKRNEYLKEELIEFWDGLIARHDIRVRSRVKLLGLARAADHFEAETSAGVLRARTVLLALGRRGTPRRLGVPGEEAEHVLYQLIDAATYRDSDLLVVGGGDSAIEAATALADQTGNRVSLSYRKHDFFRLKSRNEERIREYAACGRIQLLLESQVAAIEKDQAILDLNGERRTVPAQFVFVFAGGVPPFPLLKSVGVGFGAEAEEAA